MDDFSHTHGLDELSHATRYRQYLFDLIAPWCGSTVLEVGAGLGDFAALFDSTHELFVSDPDALCLESLTRRFEGDARKHVLGFDLSKAADVSFQVDSIVAINVLEHIEDDVAALRNVSPFLFDRGNVILFVPAYMKLYGQFDRMVGHYRRYSPVSLRQTVEAAGYRVNMLRPVNMIGAVAWWLAVKLGKRTRPRPGVVKAYDRVLVPVVRLIERKMQPRFGQSLLCVAEFKG